MVFVVHGSGMVRSAWMLAAKQEQLMQFESWIGGSCTCNWFCQDFRGLVTVVSYHCSVRFTSFFCILCSVLDSPHFVVGGSGPGEFFVGSCQDSSGTFVLRTFPQNFRIGLDSILMSCLSCVSARHFWRQHHHLPCSTAFVHIATSTRCPTLSARRWSCNSSLPCSSCVAPFVNFRFSGDGGGSSRSWVDALCQVLIWGEWYFDIFCLQA